MKNILNTLPPSYKSNGLHFACQTLLMAGIFYACLLSSTTIRGAVPPCESVIGSLIIGSPLDCKTTGKAAPFFVATTLNYTVMSYTEQFGVIGAYTPKTPTEICNNLLQFGTPEQYKIVLHDLLLGWLSSHRPPNDKETLIAHLDLYEQLFVLVDEIENYDLNKA